MHLNLSQFEGKKRKKRFVIEFLTLVISITLEISPAFHSNVKEKISFFFNLNNI